MQASLRWNDIRGRNGFVAILTSPVAIPEEIEAAVLSVIPAQAGIQWFKPSIPASGNDKANNNPERPPPKPVPAAIALSPFPATIRPNPTPGENPC